MGFRLCDWRISKNRLKLEEFLKPSFSPFPPITRLLVSSEATREVNARTIHVHIACANSLGNAASPVDISRSYKACQTVGRIICNAYGIVLILVTDDAKHRAKDFFPRNCHVISNIRENSRPYKETLVHSVWMPKSSDNEGRSFIDTLFY